MDAAKSTRTSTTIRLTVNTTARRTRMGPVCATARAQNAGLTPAIIHVKARKAHTVHPGVPSAGDLQPEVSSSNHPTKCRNREIIIPTDEKVQCPYVNTVDGKWDEGGCKSASDPECCFGGEGYECYKKRINLQPDHIEQGCQYPADTGWPTGLSGKPCYFQHHKQSVYAGGTGAGKSQGHGQTDTQCVYMSDSVRSGHVPHRGLHARKVPMHRLSRGVHVRGRHQ